MTIWVIYCQAAVLRNNSQCLLLNKLINAKGDIFQFVENENTKNEHAQITKKKTLRKARIKGEQGEQFYNIQTTKESYSKRAPGSWEISVCLLAGSHEILPY